jgi:argininosuccinate synthase
MSESNLLVCNILYPFSPTHHDRRQINSYELDPEDAPNVPTKFSITFKAGIPVKLEVKRNESGSVETYTGSVELSKALNSIAGENGVGRIDIVESR